MWPLEPVGKDAHREIVNLGGTTTSRSHTTSRLVNKTVSTVLDVWVCMLIVLSEARF